MNLSRRRRAASLDSLSDDLKSHKVSGERFLDKRYWAGRLVFFEHHRTAASAKQRERAMKRWRRIWKIELIEKHDPTWRDLFADAVKL